MPDYRICGLSLRSEFELPGAVPADALNAAPDVRVRWGAAPHHLQNVTTRGPDWESAGDILQFHVPDIAYFTIVRGREIVVVLAGGASARDAAGFVLGTALGVLLHQRSALVLHGAAVARRGRAIAICGASGAGKSTLAAALCREGCNFVADDICVVGLDERRHPIALPDGRRLKLWQESIDQLDLGSRKEEPVRETFEKYFVEPIVPAQSPPDLCAIYALRVDGLEDGPRFEPLTLPDAMRLVQSETYRPGLSDALGCKSDLFAKAAATFSHAKAFVLIRPRGFDRLGQTVAKLLAHWEALA